MVEAALDLSDLIRGVGWAGAVELSSATFEGWEVDFLAAALGILASDERGQALLEQYRLWATILGASRG